MSDNTSSASSSTTLLDKDHLIRQAIEEAVRQVRMQTPLAQSFTNFVTINLVANAQLAVGGSAAMSYLPDDIADVSAISGASYINVGTLLPFFAQALPEIAQHFAELGHPWVLDPVAAGLGNTRTKILTSFKNNPPSVVRGNASEIITLAHMWDLDQKQQSQDSTSTDSRPAGVESVDDVDHAQAAAMDLARYLAEHGPTGKACVAVSGAVDLVTDGNTIYRLPGGSALMTKITGAGCSLGGVIATYLAVSDPLTAALAGSAHYNLASEQAAAISNGPGSFQSAFLDSLWNVSAADIADSPILLTHQGLQ